MPLANPVRGSLALGGLAHIEAKAATGSFDEIGLREGGPVYLSYPGAQRARVGSGCGRELEPIGADLKRACAAAISTPALWMLRTCHDPPVQQEACRREPSQIAPRKPHSYCTTARSGAAAMDSRLTLWWGGGNRLAQRRGALWLG